MSSNSRVYPVVIKKRVRNKQGSFSLLRINLKTFLEGE